MWNPCIGTIFSLFQSMTTKKILIIDDETDFSSLLKTYFERKSCEVIIANSITSGMEALETFRPDYLFLDNNLPDGLGWSKTEFILTNYPFCQLNLISGHLVPKTSAMNFRIIEKPLSFNDLDDILKNEPFAWKKEGKESV